MAKINAVTKQIASIVFIILGVGLIIWGYKESGSIGSQLTSVVSGSDDDVMMLYIGGAVSLAVGVFIFVKK